MTTKTLYIITVKRGSDATVLYRQRSPHYTKNIECAHLYTKKGVSCVAARYSSVKYLTLNVIPVTIHHVRIKNETSVSDVAARYFSYGEEKPLTEFLTRGRPKKEPPILGTDVVLSRWAIIRTDSQLILGKGGKGLGTSTYDARHVPKFYHKRANAEYAAGRICNTWRCSPQLLRVIEVPFSLNVQCNNT